MRCVHRRHARAFVRDLQVARAPGPRTPAASRAFPAGVCTSALSSRARQTWSTRSSSARAIGRPSTSTSTGCPRCSARTRNSSATACATSPRSTGSCSTRIRPASSRERSSRSVASFGEPVDLLAHRLEELAPCLLVELLVGHQLEEAAEREERRPQLVRGVGDELAPGAVEVLQPRAHALERDRELPELVVAGVDDGLVEASVRDPLGGALEPGDPARVQRGERPSRRQRRRAARSGRRRAAAARRSGGWRAGPRASR